MILRGDCVEVMAGMDAGSVDAIVTDPPYGLGFMGKQWDELPPGREWAGECLRVLKPGGHLLAFGGTRTYHRLTVAIEDAGFEIRDCLSWLYGSGFPKSHDVSKAIDKAAGAEREVVGTTITGAAYTRATRRNANEGFESGQTTRNITAPATDDAAKWEGFGTALKPSWEPIIMARKPLIGTVAANVLGHGTGALNIDGCRIEAADKTKFPVGDYGDRGLYGTDGERTDDPNPSGRWPANTVLDEDAAAILDAQAEDTSRFFYVAKASRKERNAGLEGFEEKAAGVHDDDSYVWPKNGDGSPRNKKVQPRANHHPTVKPINLMRWLVRMVTPPGGTVLDPFTGSGTTGCAAALEGFDFIGIEREPEYADIAEARIKHWTPDQLELA